MIILKDLVTPKQTTIQLEGDWSSLPTKGFLYFVGLDDFFYYGNRVDDVLQEVEGMIFVHVAGEEVVEHKGLDLEKIVASLDVDERIDKDGVVKSLVEIINSRFKEFSNFKRKLRSYKNPLYSDLDFVSDFLVSLGIYFEEYDSSEDTLRTLLLSSAELLKDKGTSSAFKLLVYLVTGYYCTVRRIDKYLPIFLGSSSAIMLDPPKMLEVDRISTGVFEMNTPGLPLIPNVADSSSFTDGTITNPLMWDATIGCSLFPKHTTLNFTLLGDELIIPGASKHKTSLLKKTAYSIEVIYKPFSSVVYPQNIFSKDKVFYIHRTDPTSIRVFVRGLVDTITFDALDCLYEDKFNYIAFSVNENGLNLVVNDKVLCEGYYSGFQTDDDDSSYTSGGPVFPLYGAIDMIRISYTDRKIAEFLNWYYPLFFLRSVGEKKDLTNYYFDELTKEGDLEITITNYDGKHEKIEYLQRIFSDWLGVGKIYLNPAGNILLDGCFFGR